MALPSTDLIRFDKDGAGDEKEGEEIEKGDKPAELLNSDDQEQRQLELRRGQEIEIDGVEEEDGENTVMELEERLRKLKAWFDRQTDRKEGVEGSQRRGLEKHVLHTGRQLEAVELQRDS